MKDESVEAILRFFYVDKYNDLKLTAQTKVKLKPIQSDNDQFVSFPAQRSLINTNTCNAKYSKKQPQCQTPNITEVEVKEKFVKAYNLVMCDKKTSH